MIITTFVIIIGLVGYAAIIRPIVNWLGDNNKARIDSGHRPNTTYNPRR